MFTFGSFVHIIDVSALSQFTFAFNTQSTLILLCNALHMCTYVHAWTPMYVYIQMKFILVTYILYMQLKFKCTLMHNSMLCTQTFFNYYVCKSDKLSFDTLYIVHV